jgi:acylphosphatase
VNGSGRSSGHFRSRSSVVRRRVLVSGRVQGVFFRDACRQAARRERVSGWVRNRGDGRVEACFEGEPDAVARLVAWCRQGPPRAHVHDVEVFEERPENAAGFFIC